MSSPRRVARLAVVMGSVLALTGPLAATAAPAHAIADSCLAQGQIVTESGILLPPGTTQTEVAFFLSLDCVTREKAWAEYGEFSTVDCLEAKGTLGTDSVVEILGTTLRVAGEILVTGGIVAWPDTGPLPPDNWCPSGTATEFHFTARVVFNPAA